MLTSSYQFNEVLRALASYELSKEINHSLESCNEGVVIYMPIKGGGR